MSNGTDEYWDKIEKVMEKKGLRKTRANLIGDMGNFEITKKNMKPDEVHHERQILKMRAKFLNKRIMRCVANNKKKKPAK